jgi:glutaminyl-tRNA synthetase
LRQIDESLLKWNPSVGSHFQFERIGFFVLDIDSDVSSRKFVFNLTVGLKDVGKPKVDNSYPTKSRKVEQEKQLALKMVSLISSC